MNYTNAEKNLIQFALSVKAKADAYPRCGEGWPASTQEQQAAAILGAAGNPTCLPLSDEQKKSIDSFNKRDGALKARVNAAYDDYAAAKRTWMRNRSNGQARAEMLRLEQVYTAARREMMTNINDYGQLSA